MWDSGHTRKAHKSRPSASESCQNGDVPALTLSAINRRDPYSECTIRNSVSRRAFLNLLAQSHSVPGGHGSSASGITCVSVVIGRNALNAFEQQITRRRMADVAQTEDADHPLALVDHWQLRIFSASMCRTALARSPSSRQQWRPGVIRSRAEAGSL